MRDARLKRSCITALYLAARVAVKQRAVNASDDYETDSNPEMYNPEMNNPEIIV